MSARVRRSRPGRLHSVPQTYSVMSSWNGRLKSVVVFAALSTYSSPSTSRRTFWPCSYNALFNCISSLLIDQCWRLDIAHCRLAGEFSHRADAWIIHAHLLGDAVASYFI